MAEQKPQILLADDEATFRETSAKVLEEEGFAVTAVCDGKEATDAIMKQPHAVAILDIQMPGSDGISVLREVTALRPQTRVIMVTAYGTVEMAVEAIKLGACDYVMKPVNFDEMLTKIRQHLRYVELEAENQKLREELDGRFDISQIIGATRVMKQVFETIRKVAPTCSNVLITGESGTGKELVAHAIHALSGTIGGRFIAVKAYEREQICRVLNKYDWDKIETAKALGIGVSSLYRKIDELGIADGRERTRKTGQR